VKSLRLERVGSRDRFRFKLEGAVDPAGARSLDRLLFECQARGARAVHLDFSEVTEVSTLGMSVLARQGRVYEETERRIQVSGLSPTLRQALAEVEAIVYESNVAEAVPAAVAVPPAAVPASAAPAPVALPLAPPTPASPPSPPPPPAPVSSAEIATLQAKLKRKILEFRNLFEIARGLNLALDLDEVLNLFSLSVMGQFGIDRLGIFLAEPHGDRRLVPKQVRGFAHDHFRHFTIPAELFRVHPAEEAFFELGPARGAAEGESSEGGHDASAEGTPGGDTVVALQQCGFEWGVALWVRRDLEGVMLLGGRGGRKAFQEDERDLLTTLANQGAVAIANARHHRAQEERNLGLVRGMMSLIESRDAYAKGSTERVVRYVTATAKMLQYPKESLKSLIYGAVLRDIGMITVNHLILKNPAHLSDEEWALIKQHPTRGAQILEEMNLPKEVVDVVLNHHERWGGEGYPAGIRGTEIPLGARIVSLVDGYVAMTAERPYRRALPYEKARQVIAENWGSPFDPSIVEVFLHVLDKMEKRYRQRLGEASPEDSNNPPARAELDPLSSGATIPMETHK
jgi:anti-anti-sigma regulatory factor